jgi:hypothetical protein
MVDRVFDRIPDLDPRNRNYPIRTLIDRNVVVPRGWSLKTQLDQGSEGACVGFAWAHELAAVPRKIPATNDYARNIYYRAQQIDQWEGEAYEGTSVLAGAKVIKEQNHMMEYRWAFGLNDALLAISHYGPVVFGLNWYWGMMEPDDKGYVYPSGGLAGGHAIVGIAVHTKTKRIVLQNSWGDSWGKGGRCYVKWDALDELLQQDGECCVPVGRQ